MTPATDGPRPLPNRLAPLAPPVVVTAVQAVVPRRVTARAAVVALVALGVILRLAALLSDRCLWIDEAMLALNLVDRTPRELLEPLDWNQGAPVGFLLAAKAGLLMFGTDEWAFRVVPFAAPLAGLLGFAWVARRLLPAPAAVMAVTLAAISPYLINYAAECKQYATDAALAVAMLAASVGLLQRQPLPNPSPRGGGTSAAGPSPPPYFSGKGDGGLGRSDARRWTPLAVAGAVAVWFSHPVAFVLGGIGTALFIEAVAAMDRRRAGACTAVIACWLAIFGV
jgi:hypothetical protein